ncbi:MAG: lysophospholipid acyltransferase family protein [Muribaculaceae bacterium]
MEEKTIKRTVLDYDDFRKIVPFFNGKVKLVNWLLKLFSLDKVNALHDHNCDTPGPEFVEGILKELQISTRIDNEKAFDELRSGAFITVSNHPFGALDGIILLHIVTKHRPTFKVMVNMFLNHISAMRPNFISVDPLASNNPAKRAITMSGIREAMLHVKGGNPIGFFPAGAVSKINSGLRIQDRQWQPTIIRLIQQLDVPVVPIYFHGHNSTWFNILGTISWKLRTLRLPAEVFLKKGKTFHISVGDPVSTAEQAKYTSVEELGEFLKQRTYSMRKWK